MDNLMPRVSVVMPKFEQPHFIARALDSLLAQSVTDWELLIIDDGSQDATARIVLPYLQVRRIRCLHLLHNTGLGQAINEGLDRVYAPYVAYLPSDDVWDRDHLRELIVCLDQHPQAALAFAGVRHHYNREAPEKIAGTSLQLVQCMHRATNLRWTTRDELESDDLYCLFWARPRREGLFVGTRSISCEWGDHPAQRHKVMREPVGGINLFRQRYRVNHPLRFSTSSGNAIDETGHYRAMRERADTPSRADRLKILLVGELAFNAERALALEEQRHSLHRLWMDNPYWYNTVGPLRFGHVRELPRANWREAVRELQPDVIYAGLNWQAVPFCHEVLKATPGLPFCWHFKEGPFICMEQGSWPQLVELFQYADGRIFTSPEMRDWFDTVLPGLAASRPCHVLDGDLSKMDWFDAPLQPLPAHRDGEIHTVVPGRPIGLHPHTVAALAAEGAHLHFYGDFTHGQWRQWIDNARALAPRHLHLHANVEQARWVAEFSRYDAGWLHAFVSANRGELRRANWDDLNYPVRMATLAAAGLPMIQRRNEGAIVASQALTKKLGIGIFNDNIGELAATLRDCEHMGGLRASVWRQRAAFTFDYHLPELVAFFRSAISHAGRSPASSRSDA